MLGAPSISSLTGSPQADKVHHAEPGVDAGARDTASPGATRNHDVGTRLQTAVSHNNEIVVSFSSDPFKGIDVESATPDIPAAKTAVATVRQTISKWQALISSDGSALQAELGPALKSIQQLRSDMQALVAAVEARDIARNQKYVAAIEADGNAVDKFDPTAADAATKALFQPLIAADNRDMQIAAGG